MTGDVFVLGAGFSKAISDEMPVLSELPDLLKGDRRENDWLPLLLKVRNNVEHLMTLLAQPQPWASEADNLERRAVFLRFSERLAEVVRRQQNEAIGSGPCPDWLDRLVARWAAGSESVITFNYDTLVERAYTMHEGRDDESRLSQELYVTPMTNLRSRRGYLVLASGNDEDTFTLVKLHGSVNWFYSGAPQSAGEVLYLLEPYDGWQRDPQVEQMREAPDKVPLIVPPTTDKSTFLSHESVRAQWQRASLELDYGQHVFFIGYSMPQTDLMVRFMLQNTRWEAGTAAVVVNRVRNDDDVDALIRTYEGLGLPLDWNFDYVTTEDVLPRFVDDYLTGSFH